MDTTGPSLIGMQLGRYRVESRLGAGGMGEVYRAFDVELHRPVALKTLRPEVAVDRANLERFFAEARAANVIRHEHIIEYTDMHKAEPGGLSYVVMELCEGRTLTRAIRDIGRLPPARAAFILAQVADALEAAHRAGIVHRDLKPDNVFLIRRMGTDDYVKVLDFGVARLRPDLTRIEATQSGVIIGTPAYMSPEQCKGEKVTPAADIYALGVIMFQALTGQLPFDGPTMPMMLVAHMTSEAPPVHSLVPDVPYALSALVQQALAKHPAERPPSMAALRATMLTAVGLEGLIASSSVPAHAPVSGQAYTMPAPHAQAAPVTPAGSQRTPSAPGTAPGGTLDTAPVLTGAVPARGQVPQATIPARGQAPRDPAPGPTPQATIPARGQAPSQPARASTGPTVAGRPDAPLPRSTAEQQALQSPAYEPQAQPSAVGPQGTPWPQASQPGAVGPQGTPWPQASQPGAVGPQGTPWPQASQPGQPPMSAEHPAFAPEPSQAGPATAPPRGHARPATPAPTLGPTPRQAPESRPGPRWIVPAAITALLLAAGGGGLWAVYGRGDSDTPSGNALVASASDAGPGAGPAAAPSAPDAAAVARAPDPPAKALDPRASLDALSAAHGEPAAPAACQSSDAALLPRLVRAATLLQGGAPDGRREQDIEAVRLLAAPEHDAAEYWYWLAKARLFADANVAAVAEAAERAIAACPDYAAAHNTRGSALFRDRPADAVRAYEQAVTLAPRFADARLNLGLVQLQLGIAQRQERELAAALISLTAVIDDPAAGALRTTALLTRGQVHLMTGEHERAVSDLEAALAAAPDDAPALFLLGQAYKLAGKLDASREAMCKAKALGHAPAAEHCR